ncbi:hypothetical protein B9Z55_018946 [Caenorhabditis nigoni]|uniref:SPK domain-containing protein n=1 Tax=Caenorhabditis nigoni TaxID=1611254 RepID=A0A2G5TG76_9PELO|nr:hypothetical protein B9Z55_018946 [Caenorhabditis nigoni]
MPKNKKCETEKLTEKAIKFISNGIKNCTEPESLRRWCELAKTEVGYDKSAHSINLVISSRLDRIEDLKGYSLMEKVRLVFIFSKKLSDVFVKELKDQKYAVELNDERKMTYFRSPEGDCVLQSDQASSTNKRKFQGEHIPPKTRLIRFMRDDQCEKAIKFLSSRIKNYTKPQSLEKWSELAKKEVGYDKNGHSFSWVISKRLDRIEHLKGYSLMEKVQLVYIFRRPVSPGFLKMLKDAKCIVKLNHSRKITYFRSEDRDIVLKTGTSLEHKKRSFKDKPCTDKKKTADIQVKTRSNVQTQPPPPSPQSLPDPPEMDDVEIGNEKKEAAQEKENKKNKAAERKKKENRGTSTKQKSILNTEEDADVTTESIQQEAPFNGRIDYDDFDNGEYPGFMVPDEIEPPMQHNKRHQTPSQETPKRRKIDKPEEPEVVNPPEVNDVETRNEEGKEAPEQIPEDSNEPTSRVTDELDQSQAASVGYQSIDNNLAENLVQITQKRVKIEGFLEETDRAPEEGISDKKPEVPPPTISLRKLAEQIETFAFNIYLDENFQQKVLRAVRLFKANDQTIPIQEFNQMFNVFWMSLKRERTQNSNENSIQLIRLLKQLQRNFIRPLGEELMADAFGILDNEIEKLGESEEKIPLKTVQSRIDALMHFITSAWADLDE